MGGSVGFGVGSEGVRVLARGPDGYDVVVEVVSPPMLRPKSLRMARMTSMPAPSQQREDHEEGENRMGRPAATDLPFRSMRKPSETEILR